MFSKLKNAVVVLSLLTVFAITAKPAHATSVSANTTYTLDADSHFVGYLFAAGNNTMTPDYIINISGGGTATTGSIASGILASVVATTNFSGSIVSFSNPSNVISTITSSTFTVGSNNNVSANGAQGTVYGAQEGVSSGAAAVFNLQGNNGVSGSFTLPLLSMAVPIVPEVDLAAGAFGTTHMGLVMGPISSSQPANFIYGWVYNPNIFIAGLGNFSLKGDFNLRTSGGPQVPEPMTLSLLGLGLLGGAARKRRSN